MPPPGFWLEPCRPNLQQGVVENSLGSCAHMPSHLGCVALLIYLLIAVQASDAMQILRCYACEIKSCHIFRTS